MDHAQKRLEQFIPGLHYLKHKNLFTDEELKCILKKIKNFETSSTLRNTDPSIFFKYIAYEEALKQIKFQRLKLKIRSPTSAKLNRVWNCSRLFKRMLKIWPSDVRIWKQYIYYCLLNNKLKEALRLLIRATSTNSALFKVWFWIGQNKKLMKDLKSVNTFAQITVKYFENVSNVIWCCLKFECDSILSSEVSETFTKSALAITLLHEKVKNDDNTLMAAHLVIQALNYICGAIYINKVRLLNKEYIFSLSQLLRQLSSKYSILNILLWKIQMLSSCSTLNSLTDLIEELSKTSLSSEPYLWILIWVSALNDCIKLTKNDIPYTEWIPSNFMKTMSGFDYIYQNCLGICDFSIEGSNVDFFRSHSQSVLLNSSLIAVDGINWKDKLIQTVSNFISKNTFSDSESTKSFLKNII